VDSRQSHFSEIPRDLFEKLAQSIRLSSSGVDHSQLPMIERIEHALVLLAYFIELDGDVYVPMYEKFEAELAELKKTEATMARARQRLLTFAANGTAGRGAGRGKTVGTKTRHTSSCPPYCPLSAGV
jgi:hypothetical protein